MNKPTRPAALALLALLAASCGNSTPIADGSRPGDGKVGQPPVGDVGVKPDGGTSATDGASSADGAPPADAGASSMSGYSNDPLTLDGRQLPRLVAAAVAPSSIAAYRVEQGRWIEIPVQIDEREVRRFSSALSPADRAKRGDAVDGTARVTTSFYTNSNAAPGSGVTYVGVDSDANFDDDDELVLLVRDLGEHAASLTPPPGVDATTRTEVAVFDAMAPTQASYAYLFVRTTSGATPKAAVKMTVSFVQQSGSFTSFYDTGRKQPSGGTVYGCGSADWRPVFPESTSVETDHYTRRFSARWISDGLRIKSAGNAGPDLLDVAEIRPRLSLFSGAVSATTATLDTAGQTSCGRSTRSFSGAGGTFVTLRSGPLRAIRSYFGANSGAITQRTHLFYPRREDVLTAMRVHTIPGATDVLDLSPAAVGMTYYNAHNTKGLVIDGKPDRYDRRFSSWEMITGAPGTVLTVYRRVVVELGAGSTTQFAPQMVWLDVGAQPSCVCGGDDRSLIGVHGVQIRAPASGLPTTDPRQGSANQIFHHRVLYYLDAALSVNEAATRAQTVARLRVRIDGGAAFDPSAVSCGDGVCEANETSVNCAADCAAGSGAGSCGDSICAAGEAFVCQADCPPAARPGYFSCLANNCTTWLSACALDPDCALALSCVEGCTTLGHNACLISCGAAISDPGSRGIFQGLGTCSASACRQKF